MTTLEINNIIISKKISKGALKWLILVNLKK